MYRQLRFIVLTHEFAHFKIVNILVAGFSNASIFASRNFICVQTSHGAICNN